MINIVKHLQAMIRDFQGRAIVQLCKPYRRVRLDHIARSLKITSEDVETLLIQLILDGELGGVIDQVKGIWSSLSLSLSLSLSNHSMNCSIVYARFARLNSSNRWWC
jgi:hypothetical protein